MESYSGGFWISYYLEFCIAFLLCHFGVLFKNHPFSNQKNERSLNFFDNATIILPYLSQSRPLCYGRMYSFEILRNLLILEIESIFLTILVPEKHCINTLS